MAKFQGNGTEITSQLLVGQKESWSFCFNCVDGRQLVISPSEHLLTRARKVSDRFTGWFVDSLCLGPHSFSKHFDTVTDEIPNYVYCGQSFVIKLALKKMSAA